MFIGYARNFDSHNDEDGPFYENAEFSFLPPILPFIRGECHDEYMDRIIEFLNKDILELDKNHGIILKEKFWKRKWGWLASTYIFHDHCVFCIMGIPMKEDENVYRINVDIYLSNDIPKLIYPL